MHQHLKHLNRMQLPVHRNQPWLATLRQPVARRPKQKQPISQLMRGLPASAAGRSQVACAAALREEAAPTAAQQHCLLGRHTKGSTGAKGTWQADTCGSWLSPLQQLAHRQPLLQLCGLILPDRSHCVVLQMHVPQQLPA